MKRLIPTIIAMGMLVGFAIGYSRYTVNALEQNHIKMVYDNTDTRNFCVEAMDELTNENTILLMGSSELSASDNIGYPPSLFNHGNSDFNIIMMGRGNMQSLHHAISVGALDEAIENRKVVLIVSPQWFTASHLPSEAYASRFSERLFAGMLENRNISYETKRAIADRVEGLLQEGNPEEYKRVLLYDKAYIEKNATLPELAQLAAWNNVTSIKQKKDLLEEIGTINFHAEDETVRAEEIDYKSLLDQAEQAGIEACTNNDLYIYDEYYTKYVEPNLAARKDSEVSSSYLDSPEYVDFELFLTVCEETGISPLIVNIPVNGLWYDYTGFPVSDRQAYYQRIRDICNAHNASILDFSDKEYEHYFLKDIMHLGWKGWVYLDEGVYRYYLGQF